MHIQNQVIYLTFFSLKYLRNYKLSSPLNLSCKKQICPLEADFDEVKEISSYLFARIERPIKPIQRIQNMKISGRSKHGCCDRGNRNH